MATLAAVNRWVLSLAVVGSTSLLSGCGSNLSSDYHAIDKSASQTVRLDRPEPNSNPAPEIADVAIDALQVENVAMMSIRPEVVKPRQYEVLVPQKTFPRDRKTGALRVTYDDLNLLTVLNMDPVTNDAVRWMPGWLTSLEGQMICVRGFMYPPFQAEGLEGFVLLKDNERCCFGPGAKIYDHIQIKMKEGVTAKYVPIRESLEVIGRFKIDLEGTGGSIYQMYIIEDAIVVGR